LNFEDSDAKYFIGFGLLLGVLVLGFVAYSSQANEVSIPTQPSSTAGYLTGLNLAGLKSGNYSYPETIINHFNYSVALNITFFSDPENLTRYAKFSCSVKNGTILKSWEAVQAIFSIEVKDNPYGDGGEFYIRVGYVKL
jgi:hypothetical protein